MLGPRLLTAQTDVERLEARLPAAGGEERLELLVELAEALRRDDPARAADFGGEALEMARAMGDEGRELAVLNSLLVAHGRQRDYGRALMFGARAERLARSLRDRAGLAFALRYIGAVHRRQNRHQSSIEPSLESSRLYEELGDKALQAAALNGAGVAYLRLSDYPQALACFLRTHRLFEEAGDRQQVGRTLNNLGLVYRKLEEPDKALDYYRRALEGYEGYGDEQAIANVLNNIGNIHSDRGDAALALQYFQRSLALKEKLGDTRGIPSSLNNIGLAYQGLGNLEAALEQYGRSLALKQELGDRKGMASSLRNIASVHREKGDHGASIAALERAVPLAAEAGALEDLQGAHQDLAESWEALGRFDRALAAFRRFEEIKSEIFSERNSEIVAEMQARFESERKETEIELLKQQQAFDALELKRRETARRVQLGGLGALLLVSLLLYNRYRERAVNRRLRTLDQLKDEFLANTSHELRTPLYGIIGLAESLIDGAAGELPESARAHLAMMVASGRRLTALVDDLLDFSKLKHQSLELDARPVDLYALVDVVLALSRPLVASKDLRLRNAVPRDLPPASADENRLQQILHNLVGNAVKFTEAGEVEVSAAVRESKGTPKGGPAQLLVRVKDTGIGISKEQQEQVFEAFRQADASTEREFGGTGLGLAVTRQLVELHGGTLGVESAPGEGATFFFDLPVADALPAGAPVTPAVEMPVLRSLGGIAGNGPELSPPLADAGGWAAASILVVDDEPVIRQVLVNQLGTRGHEIVQAASGPEALALVEQRSFDLVLLDVMMPRMSGFQVCRTLRERHSLEDLPVIFLTAKSQVSDLVMGLAAGANDYLPKPVSKPELAARVETHLELLFVHRRMSRLVAERSEEVAERERLLRERERLIGKLEASNAELARFNYTIAHDLKNPLVTISNYVGSMRHDLAGGRGERLGRDLDRLETAADKMRRLLDELFELSRAGARSAEATPN